MSIKDILCIIKCNEEQGTGFFVSGNKIVTASHVVESFCEQTQITICFESKNKNNLTFNYNDISINKTDSPISVISLNCNVDHSQYLNVVANNKLTREQVQLYGFPALFQGNSAIFDAHVLSQVSSDDKNDSDNDIYMSLRDRYPSLVGMSGGPIVYGESIVGIINAQNTSNQEVITVHGISVCKVRDFLCENEITVSTFTLSTDQPICVRYGHIEVSDNFNNWIVSAINSEVEQLLIMRMNGKNKEAMDKLREKVAKIDAINNVKAYARYYMMGAIWLFSDGSLEHTQWIEKAKLLDPDIDDRIYQSMIFEGNYDEVKEILKNIDNVNVLNRLLSYLIGLRKYDECCILFNGEYPFLFDALTYYWIAICRFKQAKYEESLESINVAIEKNNKMYSFYMIKGLIIYWSVISRLLSMNPQDYILVIWENHFLLSDSDEDELNKALKCFEMADTINSSENTLKICFLIACLLKKESVIEYKKRILNKNESDTLILEYSLIHKERIDDQVIRRFRDNLPSLNMGELRIYLLYLIDSGGDVLSVIQQYNSKLDEFTKVELLVNYDLSQKNIKKAKKVVHSSCLDVNITNKLLISIDDYSSNYNNTFIKRVKQCLSKEKQGYYWNMLCRAYKSMDKPRALIKTAKEWNENSNNIRAREFLAIGYFMNKQYDKSLKTIRDIESVYTLHDELMWCKASSLVELGKYMEANTVIKNLKYSNNRNAAMLVFKISKMIGETYRGIIALEDYLYIHPNDEEVVQILVDELIVIDSEKAYKYAKDLYISNLENDRIGFWATNIAFKTDHDDIATEWLERLYSRDKKGKIIRKVSVDEIVKMQKKHLENQKKIIKSYINSEIPLAAVYELQAISSIALIIYRRFSADRENNDYMLWSYGTKPIKTISSFQILILDYQSCIALYGLKILENVFDAYEKIYISKEIIEIIDEEIKNLSDVQKSVVNKDNKCWEIINNYHIGICTDCNEEKEIFIISDKCNNNVHEGHNSIHFSTFVGYLNSTGLTSQEYDKQLYECENKYIDDSTIFVFDYGSLDEFMQLDSCIWIKVNVKISEETYLHLENKVNYNKDAIKCCEWLNELRRIIIENNIKQKIEYISYERNEKVNPALKTTLDAVDTKCKKAVPFLCMDRSVFVKCNNGDEMIYDLNDIIHSLYIKDKMDKNKFIEVNNLAWKSNIIILLPNSHYVFELLNRASFSDSEIVETMELRTIRKMLYLVMKNESIIAERSKENYELYERICYVDNVFQESLRLFVMIWNSERDMKWKIICSNWVLIYFSNYISDIEITEDLREELLEKKQLALLLTSLQIKECDKYIQWLTRYLEVFWMVNDVHNILARDIAQFISCLYHKNEQLAMRCLLKMQKGMNPVFWNEVLECDYVKEIYGEYYESNKLSIDEMKKIPNKREINSISMEEAITCFQKNSDDWSFIILSLAEGLSDRNEAFVSFPERIINMGLDEKINDSFKLFISSLNWIVPNKYIDRVILLKEKIL